MICSIEFVSHLLITGDNKDNVKELRPNFEKMNDAAGMTDAMSNYTCNENGYHDK